MSVLHGLLVRGNRVRSFLCPSRGYTAEVFWEWIPFWREESWLHKVFTDMTVTFPNDKCSHSSAKRVPHKLYNCGSVFMNLSAVHLLYSLWVPTSTRLLFNKYSMYVSLWATNSIFFCRHEYFIVLVQTHSKWKLKKNTFRLKQLD